MQKQVELQKSTVSDVLFSLLESGAWKATKYLSTTAIVRITRRRGVKQEFVLTIGKPNFQEREFIKACKKASEPFPIKKVVLKFKKKK